MTITSTFRCGALCAALLSIMLAGAASAQEAASTPAAKPNAPKQKADQPSISQPSGSVKLSRGDRSFVEKAAVDGLAEVQLGQLAQQKASNEQTKQFAARMVQDHSKSNEQLKALAATKGAELPAGLDRSHKQDYEKLQSLQGAEFDRAYMKHMVSDHKDAVSAFEKAAKSAKDEALRTFARDATPTLKEHQQLAQSTYDAIKDSGGKSAKR